MLAYRTEPISRNRGKRVYDTQRTVTRERYALALRLRVTVAGAPNGYF